jgi:DNA repair protein RadD
MIQLRPYQRGAIDSLYSYWKETAGHPIIVLPTGTGKSVVLAQFIKEALMWKGTKIVVLTHVKELIEQDYAETMALYPECPAGIYSAGLGRRDIDAQVLFAGIQSIYKKAYDLQWADLVIIDEAHLIPKNSDTMYRKFLDDLLRINPKTKFVGLTATPYRLDSGMLHEGDDALFDDICYDAPMQEMVDQGYLAPLISKCTTTQLDVSGVGKRGGEFIPGQLQAAVDIESVTRSAIDEVVAAGRNREGWLMFCSGVDHSYHVRDEIRSRGITCETIVGDTPKEERAQIIADFKAKKITCLSAMNVLTTGFNAVHVDMIGLLRPTASKGLYVQMGGRGTRLAPDKSDCLVLDFAGNIERHGPIDTIDGRGRAKSQGDGTAPTKVCPECNTYVLIAAKECICGHEFPAPKVKLEAKASTRAIMSKQQVSTWSRVTRTDYAVHEKVGKPPSMRVTYFDGFKRVAAEWICFQHTGYARTKAVQWWAKRMPDRPVPLLVSEALLQRQALPSPTQIQTKPDGKYTRITGYDFKEIEEDESIQKTANGNLYGFAQR